MARNRRKTVAYAGDMADLDALDLRQGDDPAPNPEQELSVRQIAVDRLPPTANVAY